MADTLSPPINSSIISYPSLDSSLSFADYIAQTRAMISSRRPDLQFPNPNAEFILEANSPYEWRPAAPTKRGALLIHGLLDCPFSMQDVSRVLVAEGLLCRSILLPGHGTTPTDLLDITFKEWIQAAQYGVESLQKEVEEIYLVGYSTGAALAVSQALQNYPIAGVILLAPAIKVKPLVNILIKWHDFLKHFRNHREWLYQENVIDYAKYLSIPFNAVRQVNNLTKIVAKQDAEKKLTCPVFMAVSENDETISGREAIEFFTSLNNPKSRLLLYTTHENKQEDARIIYRNSCYPELSIKNYSHVAMPFTANNPHYGQHGDYPFSSRASGINSYKFGAYNRLDICMLDLLYLTGMIKRRRRELTFNPDFDFMAQEIRAFIG